MRITPQRQEVIEAMIGGEYLIKTHKPPFKPEMTFASGRDANDTVIEGMVENNAFIPLKDGLFGNDGQSYILSESAIKAYHEHLEKQAEAAKKTA